MTQFLIDQETHEDCVPRSHVAALVAAAEERGFDRGVRAAGSGPALAAVRAEAEWRGAEKERERCAEELRAMVSVLYFDGHPQSYGELADAWDGQEIDVAPLFANDPTTTADVLRRASRGGPS